MLWIFRVAYNTVLGESLHLEIESNGSKSTIPMHWKDAEHWEIELEGHLGPIRYRYLYQRDSIELSESELREWSWDNSKAAPKKILFCDDWRSAGTEDRVYQAKLFSVGESEKIPQGEAIKKLHSNTIISLNIALIPHGMIPCLIGSSAELGEWNYSAALPMQFLKSNTWQVSLQLSRHVPHEYKYGWYDTSQQRALSLEEGENRFLPPGSDAEHFVVNDENFRRNKHDKYRAAGVAIPIFSLRSELSCGVGEFADLKPMADWATSAGLKMIQVLPINDTSSSHTWTDSYPYSAISVFALHPLYLRLDALSYPLPSGLDFDAIKQDLNQERQVDYEAVMSVKWQLSRQVFQSNQDGILRDPALLHFMDRNRDWVIDYAAFCVNRDQFGSANFSQWKAASVYQSSEALQLAKSPEGMFYIWLQYELDLQLSEAVAYLHSLGIALKGDLPIGVDRDSVDAWVSPHLFHMNVQAGAPPDAFATKGQNWGFPTYNWEEMKKDGYAWWRARFEKLSRYFDAYRIDHILGFFRIWQIPSQHVDGIMGYFDPALPIRIEEFAQRGIDFEYARYCEPFITRDLVVEKFREHADAVCDEFLEKTGDHRFALKKHLSTQREILHYFEQLEPEHWAKQQWLQDAVMDLVTEVLLFEVPGSKGTEFHPRMSMADSASYQALDLNSRWRMTELCIDYFFQRQEKFWEAQAFEKLPAMRAASDMLLCGEDLGMVPACVPGVMNKLGMLSLEIQRWPKAAATEFGDPAQAPYMSVVTTGTHDMSTLRAWWREDANARSFFTSQLIGSSIPEQELSGELCTRILEQHLHSPAMWVVFPLQDIFAMDETNRSADIEGERINVPAITPFYWRWRMEMPLETLLLQTELSSKLGQMIRSAGR